MFCRDCSTPLPSEAATQRCPHCHGLQLVRHPDAATLPIAHIDCDAFYAAVEKRDNPALRGKPVIVGGEKRGVVTTACYIARIRGVKSAMPMFQAIAKCPDAVVIKPNMAKYAEVGGQIRAHFRRLTPLVQPLSIDEAFLDVSHIAQAGQHTGHALNQLAEQILDDVGIGISIGLSHNKLLAKIASDLDKPHGFSVIGWQDGEAFLADKPVRILWGVGPAMARSLGASGIKTVGQLRALPLDILTQRYGKFGRQLYNFSRGQDERRVGAERSSAKTVSTETTFRENISEPQALSDILTKLAARLAERLATKGLKGRSVTLKLKTADFEQLTRSKTHDVTVSTAEELLALAEPLLMREATGRHFRLMGLGLSGFDEDTR